MGRKLANVIAFYLDGVAGGLVAPAADKYLASDFVDHTMAGPLDRDDLLATYEPLLHRFRDRFVWPVRGFEDGSRVFLHSYQSFGRGQVTRVLLDVFDTDAEDHLTKRWNLTVPVAPRSRSGRSQIDGPTEVCPTEPTGSNHATVRRFRDEVLVGGGYDRLDQYVHPDLAEHSPDIADGLRGLREYLDRQTAAGTPVRYGELIVSLAGGNYVAMVNSVGRGRVFDLYRLAGGRIVEHWDAADDE